MNAIEELKNFKLTLDHELENFLDQKLKKAAEVSPVAEELTKQVKDLTLRGGKRIRAALLYYSYLAHGGENKKAALQAAMAIEFSETYLLIHDDIIDDDNLRRGGITPHCFLKEKAEKEFSQKVNSKHFGISLAILAGDMACSWTNELLSTAEIDSKYVAKAVEKLNEVYTRECFGEAMDVYSIVNELKPENVIQIHQLKTVPYTFDGPIKIGAIIAGANDAKIEKLDNYIIPLGTAYQVQDDILGMFGTEEKLGKPVTSDLKEGKKTLLILNALEKCSPEQKETVSKHLGNKNVTADDLKAVREVIIETGSLTESKSLAIDLVHKALDALKNMDLKPEGKDFLLGIAEYMVNREY